MFSVIIHRPSHAAAPGIRFSPSHSHRLIYLSDTWIFVFVAGFLFCILTGLFGGRRRDRSPLSLPAAMLLRYLPLTSPPGKTNLKWPDFLLIARLSPRRHGFTAISGIAADLFDINRGKSTQCRP